MVLYFEFLKKKINLRWYFNEIYLNRIEGRWVRRLKVEEGKEM